MNTSAMIREIKTAGIELLLSGESSLTLRGEKEAILQWQDIIRQNKAAIFNRLEAFEERAAILEFDAGLPCAEAELKAKLDWRKND